MNQIKRSVSAVVIAVVLATAAGCTSTLPKESAGEYIDDAVITTKVKASLLDQPTLKSTDIRVETFKGTVNLGGYVAAQSQIDKAGEVARGVNGVRAVKNDLKLR
jgi:osmotically-inducible protein OsmY